MRRLIFLLLIAALPRVVPAREFVVNQKDAKASDANAGTAEKPLKTISAAAMRVQAGDKVVIHAGQYRETVIINASGTVDAPITFEVAPGETAVIKGSDVIYGWTRDAGDIWKAELPAVPKRSPDAKDASFWRTNDVRLVFAKDGVLLDAQHLRRVIVKEQLRPGTFFCDVPRNLLFVWLSDSSDPNARSMEVALRGAFLYVNGNNVIVRGLQMRHASTLGIATFSACRLCGENIIMENCVISWADFVGASLGGNRNKILGCTIACHGNSGLGALGKDHVIERCRVIYNNIDRYFFGWHCGGAKLIPRFVHGRIEHNEFAYNIGPGLWLDGLCNNNFINANICHDNEGTGIILEVSADNDVFNNICYNNRNPLKATYLQPDEDAEKRGHPGRFKEVQHGGEGIAQPIYHAGEGRGIYVSSSPQTKVYHNTCYLNEGEGICVEGPPRQVEGVEMSTSNCSVRNNISVSNKGSQLVLRRNGKDKTTHGNNSDYNVLLALGAVFARGGWDGVITSSLNDWRKQSGQDEHSKETDPFFAMAAMSDFRLLSISPAVKAGRPSEEVRHDFFGDTRPEDSVTIGACENPASDYPRPVGIYPGAPESP